MTKEEAGDLVDMVALARENALADALLTRPGMRKVIAPAKVNLYLNIGKRLESGYHSVHNVMHAIALHDVVYVRSIPAEPGAGRTIKVVCSGKDGVVAPDIAPEDNIAHRAVELLAEKTGRANDETVEVIIEKRIPHQAGLGGGSSDAAATLAGLSQIWGIDAADPMLYEAARELGSDVPFFLKGGCALFEGAGGEFVRSFAARHDSIVVVKPDAGLSTSAVYREFDRAPERTPEAAARAVDEAATAEDMALANNLAGAAERLMPELADVRAWLGNQDGVSSALLCGSGSATFAVCADFSTACIIAAHAQQHGWWARATSFCGARASVVPSDKR